MFHLNPFAMPLIWQLIGNEAKIYNIYYES